MTTINIEIIDDEQDSIDHSSEIVTENIVEVNNELSANGTLVTLNINSFPTVEDFKTGLGQRLPDLIIVDLAFGSPHDKSGWKVINEIIKREIIPVIVYSAHAEDLIPDEEIYKNLLIVKQKKGDENTERYKDVLKRMIYIKLNFILEKERVVNEFNKISLETCKKLIDDKEIQDIDKNVLSFLALSRLISLLLNTPPRENENFPPESIFIYPPLEYRGVSKNSVMLGDIIKCKDKSEMKGLWIVCSPSCDLVFDDENKRKNKVKEVLLLPCYTKYSDVRSLHGKDPESIKSSIRSSIQNKSSKLLKSPKNIFKSNFLLICFKEYQTLEYCKIKANLRNHNWEKVASLATPYAESLQNLFIHVLSRIGTPDTSVDKEEKKWLEEYIR